MPKKQNKKRNSEQDLKKLRSKRILKKSWLTIFTVSVIVFLYSVFSVLRVFLEYRAIDNLNLELQVNYTSIVEVENNESFNTTYFLDIDWERLLERNSDVIAWIYIPNTSISLPILQGKNNYSYLHHDIDRNRSVAGSIFMEESNSPDFMDLNTIIHGHNMRNGSMFTDIHRAVSEKLNNFSDYIYIYLPNGVLNVYRIIGLKETNASNPIYQREVRSLEDYLQIALSGQVRDLTFNKNNVGHILSLSTCGSGGANTLNRSVIFAGLINQINLYDA